MGARFRATTIAAAASETMQHLPEIKARCVGFFGERFAQLLAGLPALLTERIASSETDRQRNRYLDARNALAAAREQVMRDYEAALTAAFDAFAQPPAQADSGARGTAALSLIDKASYEDDVAARAAAAGVAAEHAEALWKLNRRLAVVRGGRKFADADSPCGPWQLCRAAQEALRSLPVDALCRRYLYQVYAREVLASAGDCYRDINDELARRGILANLGFDLVNEGRAAAARGGRAVRVPAVADACAAQGAAPAAGARAANDPGAGGAAAGSAATHELERRQARILEGIRSAQRQHGAGGGRREHTAAGAGYGALSSDGVEGRADTFSARDIAAALDELQASLRLAAPGEAAPGAVAGVQGRLIDALSERGAREQRGRITALDADTIDLVGMLFEYMLDDPQLPDRLKSLLSYLHTPYLKVALLDPTFFASVQHPARRLLDLLASSGVRWVETGEDDDRVYLRMRQVVECVIADFRDDLQVFDEQCRGFSDFLQALERRAGLAERRSMETQKGLDKLGEAQAMVARELSRRTDGARLAAAVKSVLVEPWGDYLVYIRLRHGTGSDAWRDALAVVDELVALSTGGAAAAHPGAVADLQERIALGLQTVGCDRLRSDQLLRGLAESFAGGGAESFAESFAAHPLPAGVPDPGAASTAPAARKLSAIARQMERQDDCDQEAAALSAREQALAASLAAVEFGTWFEFRRDGSRPRQRLKLCWYSPVSGNYMFVNSAGVKSAVKSLREMLHGLNDGTIVILEREQSGLFERATAAVLLRLKRH